MTSTFQRSDALRRLADDSFDLLVVGGGITGVGVALDAATRGLRVALVERDDYASGTSSKSSKLVHGGLRYLQQGEIGLVYEALHERQRLRRNAPHLVRLLPFMIPVLTKHGVVSRKIARAFGSALWMYDLTGGWRIGKFHKRLSAEQAMAHLPTMPRDNLASAYLYYDATVDDARLALTVARTASQRGAVVVNRAALVGLAHDERGRVNAAVVEADGTRITVRTAAVVNAAGVWSDHVRDLDRAATEPPATTIRPAKGVHISVPWDKVRNDIAVVIPVPGDKRSLFVVPIGDNGDGTFQHTYVGTTDTDYQGSLDDPQCTAEDIDYILGALNAAITTTVTTADVTGAWAGLRPLVAAAANPHGRTADLSRRHRVSVTASGLVTITGGKLTTYREMAEDTVDAVLRYLYPDQRLVTWTRRSSTKRLTLAGGQGYVDPPPGSPDAHLARRYGSMAEEVRALIRAEPALGQPLVDGLPYLRAEAIYAVRHEQATTLDDVLSRRTRARLFDRRGAVLAAPAAAELLARELHWSHDDLTRNLEDFTSACAREDDAALAHSA